MKIILFILICTSHVLWAAGGEESEGRVLIRKSPDRGLGPTSEDSPYSSSGLFDNTNPPEEEEKPRPVKKHSATDGND